MGDVEGKQSLFVGVLEPAHESLATEQQRQPVLVVGPHELVRDLRLREPARSHLVRLCGAAREGPGFEDMNAQDLLRLLHFEHQVTHALQAARDRAQAAFLRQLAGRTLLDGFMRLQLDMVSGSYKRPSNYISMSKPCRRNHSIFQSQSLSFSCQEEFLFRQKHLKWHLSGRILTSNPFPPYRVRFPPYLHGVQYFDDARENLDSNI